LLGLRNASGRVAQVAQSACATCATNALAEGWRGAKAADSGTRRSGTRFAEGRIMQARSDLSSRVSIFGVSSLALGALLCACSGGDAAAGADEAVAQASEAIAIGGPRDPDDGPIVVDPTDPRGPRPFPPRPPRPTPPPPPVPTTEYCPDVNPTCSVWPSTFTSAPTEQALKNAGCAAPVFYHSGRPHDTPFAKAALCPASPAVRQIVANNVNTYVAPTPSAAACDACLPKAPAGAVYIFFKRTDVIGPNCPNNCFDMPWADESGW
jgi:hypothetical protein